MRLAFAALLFFAACDVFGGSTPDGQTNNNIDAGAHAVPDMRFKWVGSGLTLMVTETKTMSVGSTEMFESHHDDSTFLPVAAGGNGTWGYYHAMATVQIGPSDCTIDTNTIDDIEGSIVSGNTITSVDVGGGGYVFTGARGLADSFDSHTIKDTETRAALTADVASYAALHQVTTAVGGPDGQMVVIAEQFTGDTKTYQTTVVDATLTNLQTQAQTLASGGYVITASGIMGDPNQIVLVGTKMPGGPASYSIMAVNGSGRNINIDSALAAGYQVVVNVYDGSSSHVILEK